MCVVSDFFICPFFAAHEDPLFWRFNRAKFLICIVLEPDPVIGQLSTHCACDLLNESFCVLGSLYLDIFARNHLQFFFVLCTKIQLLIGGYCNLLLIYFHRTSKVFVHIERRLLLVLGHLIGVELGDQWRLLGRLALCSLVIPRLVRALGDDRLGSFRSKFVCG